MTIAVPPALAPELRAVLDRQGGPVAAEVSTLRELLPEILEPGDSIAWADPSYRDHAARLAWTFSEQPNLPPHA